MACNMYNEIPLSPSSFQSILTVSQISLLKKRRVTLKGWYSDIAGTVRDLMSTKCNKLLKIIKHLFCPINFPINFSKFYLIFYQNPLYVKSCQNVSSPRQLSKFLHFHLGCTLIKKQKLPYILDTF